ncbi:MAG: sigma-54 dependent transcriptional regulator [Planctomycetota bacterium]
MSSEGPPIAPLSVLVVDDEPNIRRTLTICLEGCGHKVAAVSNPRDALAVSVSRAFDLAFVDLRLGTELGLDLIPKLLAQSPWTKIVVITAYASVDTAVEAMKRGASDYLPKPFTPAQVELVANKLARMRGLENEVVALQQILAQVYPEVDLSSSSPVMQRAVALARQVAATDATVLIRGESGTGKGVLARALHLWSNRAHKPFTVVACPALSAELLESELFGHVRGAFTGAVRDHPGRIAVSEGGTLFLDEIGALPLALQPKLLRFLQERQFERIGEAVTRTADVRVLSATNCDLEAALKAGNLREDLFYRLNVIQIDVPALRDRAEDIVPLGERLLAFFSRQNHRRALEFAPDALEALKHFAWPGNVRELRNVVERAAILCQGEQVRLEHLPPVFRPQPDDVRLGDQVSLAKIEEEHIRRVLVTVHSLDEAARILGIDQATLWRRRKQYGL